MMGGKQIPLWEATRYAMRAWKVSSRFSILNRFSSRAELGSPDHELLHPLPSLLIGRMAGLGEILGEVQWAAERRSPRGSRRFHQSFAGMHKGNSYESKEIVRFTKRR